MDPRVGIEIDLTTYARLTVALADPEADRDAVLAAHGLDEARWEVIDDAWQNLFSEAVEAHGDGDGVPPLVTAWSDAFARAQAERARDDLSFERWIDITRAAQRGEDLATLLKRFGTTLESFLAAHQRWTARVLEDPELAARFQAALRGGR